MHLGIKKVSFRQPTLAYFNWPITKYCNYKCSYCFADNTLSKQYAHTDAWESVIEKLKTIPEFNICITGGEPFYHPDIIEIINRLHETKVKNIYLFTNFSTPIDYNLLNTDKVTMQISYHPEYDSKFKKEKLLVLKELGIKYSLTLMMHDRKYWDELQSMLDFADEHDLQIDLSILNKSRYYTPIYTPKFKEKFSKYFKQNTSYETLQFEYDDGSIKDIDTYDLRHDSLNSFKGWKCQAKMFNIGFNGSITNACTGVETLIPGAICPHDTCNGTSKLEYTKERI